MSQHLTDVSSLHPGATNMGIVSAAIATKMVEVNFVNLNPFYKLGFPYMGKVTHIPPFPSQGSDTSSYLGGRHGGEARIILLGINYVENAQLV